MATNVRDFFERFMRAIDAQDFDELEAMIHPDLVADTPQSAERARGFAGFKAQMAAYPGGGPSPVGADARLLGDDERWAMTPAFTVVPLAGRDEYTVLLRSQYPDGAWWRIILLVELRDDRVFRVESYFAPELEPPLSGKIGVAGAG